MKSKIFIAAVLFTLSVNNAFAHEYWLEPESFFLGAGEKAAVRLYVGDGLVKDREEKSYQPVKTTLFRLYSVSKNWDLKSSLALGAMPIYSFSAEKPGNYLLAMERNWSYLKLDAEKFEEYLREDGMEYVIAEREKLGESAKEGRERYSRYLKSLLQVGDKHDKTYKRRVGLKLEIIPLKNPYLKKIGDALQFQITFDGEPLVGRTVFADNRESATQKMTTDKRGRVTIKIDRKGLWMVRLVTMRRCRTDCNDADWESFWGALTFGV